jgi:hypothetical protein
VGITLSVSFLLGPLLGGAISEWNWRGIFWFKSEAISPSTDSNSDIPAVSPSVLWQCLGFTPSGLKNDATGTAPWRRSPKSTSSATCFSPWHRFFWCLPCRRPAPSSGVGPAPSSFGLWSQQGLVGSSSVCGSTTFAVDPASGSSPFSRCVLSEIESTFYASCKVPAPDPFKPVPHADLDAVSRFSAALFTLLWLSRYPSIYKPFTATVPSGLESTSSQCLGHALLDLF